MEKGPRTNKNNDAQSPGGLNPRKMMKTRWTRNDLQPKELRIVLVGKTGVGKSATGNTILGQEFFPKAASSKSVTKECHAATETVDRMKITVVDTPGWCDTELPEAVIVEQTVKCIDMSCPGPHVFLIVLSISSRFTEEENKTITKIQEVFGEGASKYMIVLFTRGDDLEDRSIEDYVKEAADDLQNLLSKCGDRYHVFNNKDKNNHDQVSTLLQKIQKMVTENGGGCYSNTTYQLLESYKKREAELQQKMQETEKQLQLKIEELQKMEQFVQQAKTMERVVSAMEQLEMKTKEELKWHQCCMQEKELENKAADLKHRERLLETEKERQQILKEHNNKMAELERQRQQQDAEIKELLIKNLKSKSKCSIC